MTGSDRVMAPYAIEMQSRLVIDFWTKKKEMLPLYDSGITEVSSASGFVIVIIDVLQSIFVDILYFYLTVL